MNVNERQFEWGTEKAVVYTILMTVIAQLTRSFALSIHSSSHYCMAFPFQVATTTTTTITKNWDLKKC
jgi:hypothetical protein